MTLEIERTVVIGTGLIGGSLAAAGRRAGVLRKVVGVGRGRLCRAPLRAASSAATRPAGPAPTTSTSQCWLSLS